MNTRREPTTGDAILGVTTLVVLLLDVILLLIMLFDRWSTPGDPASEVWGYTIFLMALLIFGFVTGIGIILRSLGASKGMATPRTPLITSAARVGVLVIAPLLEWDGSESSMLASGYLFPATVLFLVLALVNLSRRHSAS